jgi:hypothetical protein
VEAVRVVSRQALRRWLVVTAAVGVVVALPPVIAAIPAGGSPADPAQLRQRILDSASHPYQGYAESAGRLGVPDLEDLSDVTTLLNSTVRLRAWYAGPERWRVAQLGRDGAERDIYHPSRGLEYVWDYGQNLMTQILGVPPLRLPRSADLTPPELARRVLSAAPGDPVGALPVRRVADRDAVGVRLTPADPGTTIAAVDIWADPATAIPLQVDVRARGAAAPVLSTRFLDFSGDAPTDDALKPKIARGVGYTSTRSPDLASAVGNFGFGIVPQDLLGKDRRTLPPGFGAVGVYGTGLASFVVLPLPRNLGGPAFTGLKNAGGTQLTLPGGGTAVALSTPLVSVLLARFPGLRRTYLLAGFDTATVLRQAATELADKIEVVVRR